jgi:hypothetical protein
MISDNPLYKRGIFWITERCSKREDYLYPKTVRYPHGNCGSGRARGCDRGSSDLALAQVGVAAQPPELHVSNRISRSVQVGAAGVKMEAVSSAGGSSSSALGARGSSGARGVAQ